MQLSHLSDTPMDGRVLHAYRNLLSSLSADGNRAEIDGAISSIAPVDRFYISERRKPTHRPRLIAHRLESMLEDRMADYMERFFLRDPIADAIEAATEDGEIVVLRVGPKDIPEAEYRALFFEQPKIVERLSFVQRISDRWLILNLARKHPFEPFTDEEVASFASLSQLLLPLAAKQASVSARDDLPQADLSIEEFEQRFASLFPSLSQRERQVCARTVIGMTSEATSLDLGIGIGSVQTYRKRAFQRLGICSAFQLAHLIMR